MKKIATTEQLREYRNLTDNMKFHSDFEKINAFEDEYDVMCHTFEENGQTGVKDMLGEILVPAMFDDIPIVFSDQFRKLAIVAIKDGKYGLVKPDGKGTIILDCVYDNIHFSNWFYYVVKDGKCGLFNNCGGELLPVMADKIYEPWNDLIIYEADGKTGFSMMGSGVITEALYESYEINESEDLVVTLDGKQGYIDEDGRFTEDPDELWFTAACLD